MRNYCTLLSIIMYKGFESQLVTLHYGIVFSTIDPFIKVLEFGQKKWQQNYATLKYCFRKHVTGFWKTTSLSNNVKSLYADISAKNNGYDLFCGFLPFKFLIASQCSSEMPCGIERWECPDREKSPHWIPICLSPLSHLTFLSHLPTSCQSSRGSDGPSETADLHQTYTPIHTYIYMQIRTHAGILREIELSLLWLGLTLNVEDTTHTHTPFIQSPVVCKKETEISKWMKLKPVK